MTGATCFRGPAGVDDHDLRFQQPSGDGPVHRGDQRIGRQGAVREEHLDERAGSFAVAHHASGGVPILLVRRGERTARLRLHQGGGTRQSTWFDRQHLEVVVQDQNLDEPADRPLVPGHHGRSVHGFHGRRGQPDGDPATRQPGRDGVKALPHRDPRP